MNFLPIYVVGNRNRLKMIDSSPDFTFIGNNPENINALLVPETQTCVWGLSSHHSRDGFLPTLLMGCRLQFNRQLRRLQQE